MFIVNILLVTLCKFRTQADAHTRQRNLTMFLTQPSAPAGAERI